MFGVGVGVRVGGFTPVSSGGGFDPDAQAFFDRVTTAGGTLSETEKSATNQLVLDMKSAGIWSSMKAIYPMVGASAAACAQNLKSSSFTGTFTSGWTFASTGVTPNGTSAFMNTGIIPSVQLTQDSASIGVYLRTNNIDVVCDIGTSNTPYNQGLYLFYNVSGFEDYSRNNNNVGVGGTTSGSSSGFIQNKRTTSNDMKVIRNATTPILNGNPTTGLSTNAVYIGAMNANGSANLFSNRQNAFAYVGDGLTDTQASNFYTAVQAFQTTLSRNV